MKLITEMLGRELVDEFEASESQSTNGKVGGETFLQVRGFARRGMINPIDLTVKKGEIVGLAGLLGSGRSETAKLIFGIEKAEQGEAFVKGRKVNLGSPRKAIHYGIGLCPEDRKAEGIIDDLSVRENIILALQAKRGWFKHIPYKRQEQLAQEMIDALRIVTSDSEKPVKELSGGNQQKVILARWLISNPEMLILDEPTRGIDVGAHAEIINIIKRLANEGKALMVISSELAEIVDYSDRVMVLRDRNKVTELEGDEVSEKMIMQAIAER